MCPRGIHFWWRKHNGSWCAFCYWLQVQYFYSLHLFCSLIFIKQWFSTRTRAEARDTPKSFYPFLTAEFCLTCLCHLISQPLIFPVTTPGKRRHSFLRRRDVSEPRGNHCQEMRDIIHGMCCQWKQCQAKENTEYQGYSVPRTRQY